MLFAHPQIALNTFSVCYMTLCILLATSTAVSFQNAHATHPHGLLSQHHQASAVCALSVDLFSLARPHVQFCFVHWGEGQGPLLSGGFPPPPRLQAIEKLPG